MTIIDDPTGSAEKNAEAIAASTGSEIPSTMGTPSATASPRARTLSPNSSSVSGDGPTNVRPASAQRRANVAFSARNPYPGCTASQPEAVAAAMTSSMSR